MMKKNGTGVQFHLWNRENFGLVLENFRNVFIWIIHVFDTNDNGT